MTKEYYGIGGCAMCGFPVYVAPPQRTWVGLTDDERFNAVREAAVGSAIRRDGSTSERIARSVEAKLKEKNGYAEEKNNG